MKKLKIVKNNKLKEFGNQQGNRIEINVRKHKGDKSELADTIKHELLHRDNPKAKEKTIQKKTVKAMDKMTYNEKVALIKKIRSDKLHHTTNVIKRKIKLSGDLQPGEMIARSNQLKSMNPRKRTAFAGLI